MDDDHVRDLFQNGNYYLYKPTHPEEPEQIAEHAAETEQENNDEEVNVNEHEGINEEKEADEQNHIDEQRQINEEDRVGEHDEVDELDPNVCQFCESDFIDPESGCACGYCVLCDQPGSLCRCERCRFCRRLQAICGCAKCSDCFHLQRECSCNPCAICSQPLGVCGCGDSWTSRIKLNNGLVRGLRLQEDGGWGFGFEGGPSNVVLNGDFNNVYVVVLRSPSRVVQEMWSWLSATFLSVIASIVAWYIEQIKEPIAVSKTVERIQRAYHAYLDITEREVEATHINVKNKRRVRGMVRALEQLPGGTGKPQIAFDMEGVNLGRYGTTCYIQIRDLSTATTYLVDLLKLGSKAWNTHGKRRTLKQIFEDEAIVKVIYAAGSDADALYHHYNVKPQGVLDVQYLYMLTASQPWEFRPNHSRAAQQLPDDILQRFNMFKIRIHDWSIFKRRPLPAHAKAYAINDVADLGLLAEILMRKLTPRGIDFAWEYSRREIENKQAEVDNGALEAEEPWYAPDSLAACWHHHINEHTVGRTGGNNN